MDKPPIPITDIQRVAGFAVVQEVRDSADYKHMGKVSVEVFEALAEREIKRKYVGIVAKDVAFYLREALELHVITHGPRDDCPEDDLETWDDALDDAIYDALKACGTFSANFVGAVSVDTRLHDPDELVTLASKAADDAWKVASFNPDTKQPRTLTPRELLDMIDIPRSLVEAYVGQHVAPTPEAVKEYKMANRQETLTKLHYARPLYEGSLGDYQFDLEQATDSDDGLSAASLERIGCDAGDKQNIADWLAELSYDLDAAVAEIDDTKHALTPSDREAALVANGDDTMAVEDAVVVSVAPAVETDEDDEAAELAALMGNVEPAPEAPPAVSAGAAPAPKGRGRKAAAVAANEDPNVIPAALLSSLKDSLGEKDEVLATGCGMSRATFNNYVKGKGTFVASDQQFNFLREMAIKRRDELNAVITAMGER